MPNRRTGAGRPTIGATGGGSGGGGGGVVGVVSGSPLIPVSTAAGVATVSELIAADWTIGLARVYAIDFVNGLDTNKGFATPATGSAADYAAACAAAGAIAKKTFAGLAAILPRYGAGRNVEVVIANGGVNTVQAYTGQLGDFLNGVYGYFSWGVRATGTNATAGCTKFDGSTADVTYQGAITVTGLNVAGYNPVGASTTSLPCQLAGGGAAALPAEPAAPLGWRVRFDSATATVGLRNQCRQIAQVTGGNTIVPQTAFSSAPANGDVFYIEQAGVSCAASNISLGTGGDSGSISGAVNCNLSGLSVALTIFDVGVRIAFCGGAAFTSSGLVQLTTSQSIVHAVLGSITVGGGYRCESGPSFNNFVGSQILMSGLVSNGGVALTNPGLTQWFTGSYAIGNLTLGRNVQGAGIDLTDFPASIGTSLASNARPRLVGKLKIIGGVTTLGNIDITGAGAGPALTLEGVCIYGIGGTVTGSTGNNDVGCDLQLAYGSIIIIGNILPTLTGALGDVRLADGSIVSWAILAATGLVDARGNRVIGLGRPPLGLIKFTGTLNGGAGATFSYLDDGGIGIANNTTPIRYPTSLRFFTRLRVNNISNTMANAVTATLYKNGVATAMTVSIPAGTAANTFFADTTHPQLFLDTDSYDLRLDDAAADATHLINVSASLEYTS